MLLGTKGGPTPSPFRAPASALLVIDGRPYLVDTPNGVAGQLAKAEVKLNDLFQIFITHNHSDHVIDAGALLVLAWGAGLNSPVELYGPPPLKQIVSHSVAASRFDIAARMREEGRIKLDLLIQVSEWVDGGTRLRGRARSRHKRAGRSLHCQTCICLSLRHSKPLDRLVWRHDVFPSSGRSRSRCRSLGPRGDVSSGYRPISW